MKPFDLTPDPKVLIALTRTPIQPLDALCELIDNSLDSFQVAKLQGEPIKSPLIIISLPKRSQIQEGEGLLSLRDNGPGMSVDMAEKALRAGFSGNNPYDSLGLFGMGFNISTGKLGRRTKFFTARAKDSKAIQVIVDLEAMNRAKSYAVPPVEVPKPDQFENGTLIEIDGWWPAGDPNNGFIAKLVQYGIPKIREEVGRRYSSILREKSIQIIINEEPVLPFEHCVWSESRFVTRQGVGQVAAKYHIDKVVGTQKRCTACFALVKDATKCPVKGCNSSSFRTIEERIRGWVGIQRFDDPVEYGIDIIRNGRAIRIAEKAAFFEFTDEFKKTIKDYPVDSPYGRIVGEVHLNHVPVDFLKQDFQRSSEEWQRAMSFLRGDSSLQPNQPGADENTSYICKLYRGYRRVRKVGRSDMYMGYWDTTAGEPRRISRDTEREYLEKFGKKLPGYYDDAEWWKLVEEADKKPLEQLVTCPACGAQNLANQDICAACDHILRAKVCVNEKCKKELPQSAAQCDSCASSQIVEVKEPWRCEVCGEKNNEEATACVKCASERGRKNPLSREYLLSNSAKSDDLSIEKCIVGLADGSNSSPIEVNAYLTRQPLVAHAGARRIPCISYKDPGSIDVFIDASHPLYDSYGVRPEYVVAQEAACFIFDSKHALLLHRGTHSVPAIQAEIVRMRWGATLAGDAVRIKSDVKAFLQSLRDAMPTLLKEEGGDIFTNLSVESKKVLINNLLNQKRDISEVEALCKSGEILRFLGSQDILPVVREYCEKFLDGGFWSDKYSDIPGLPESVLDGIRVRIRSRYINCLEDIIVFLADEAPEKFVTERARSSLRILQQNIS